jgi:UDP-GlcNAc:undecaprenyl-phosphate/decaprenyl-phosphate GlcNAc-1-phosphate transferase
MTYILVFSILLSIYLIYNFLALRFNILDNPNERSSHSIKTIRGGGIIFPLAALLWFLLSGAQYQLAIYGLLIISIISFIDDLYSISRILRILIHFTAVAMLFLQLTFFQWEWYYWLPVCIVFIGWINAFNFMDGINGITSIYSLICLFTFIFISLEVLFVPMEILIILSISVIIFAFFNARKQAKAFAGDVGSVSMAFLLGWFMACLILSTERIEYLLFFLVYGIDSIFTIFHRFLNRENIFMAHRNHLYQYLSNELKFPHLSVAGIYSAIQLAINILTIFLIRNGNMNTFIFLAIILSVSTIYLFIRFKVVREIR